MRECGECTLCCTLLPMHSRHQKTAEATMASLKAHGVDVPDNMLPVFDKPAGEKCPHEGKGCDVYARRPFGCRYWRCRWLGQDDTDAMDPPHIAGYFIDPAPDYIVQPQADGTRIAVPAVQVWVDPKRKDAYQDPALRAYMERRGADGYVTIVRFSQREVLTCIPPIMSENGSWIDIPAEIDDNRGDYDLQHIKSVLSGEYPT